MIRSAAEALAPQGRLATWDSPLSSRRMAGLAPILVLHGQLRRSAIETDEMANQEEGPQR